MSEEEIVPQEHPVEVSLDEEVMVYIDDSGNILDPTAISQAIVKAADANPSAFDSVKEDVESIRKSLAKKGFEGSTQDTSELHDGFTLSIDELVEPPYDPLCLQNFLEVDETHFRAVTTKVSDSVGRPYALESIYPIRQEGSDEVDESVSREDFVLEKKIVEQFIRNCNKIHSFIEICKMSCTDHEGVGWGAMEVIRSMDKKIARLEHVPCSRLRVIKGWKGFVEEREDGKRTYYQVFGDKVGKKEKSILTGKSIFRPFDPTKESISDCDWFFIDRETGKQTRDPSKAANEILYFPKVHPNTVYYGYSDVVPAIGAILANVYIRDYLLQFFEHNTIPRYAVIIKGAAINDDFRKLITNYFSENVKGSAHKTLILTLNGKSGKEVSIDFKALDAQNKESDFLETRREKSQQIMTAHGVSPAILGIVNSSELGSGKGLSQAEIYKDRIITPLQDYWEEKLNKLFYYGLGVTTVRLNFTPLDIRDELTQAQVDQIHSTVGARTINEIRQKIGLPSIPGGDIAFVRIREGSVFKVADLPELDSLNVEDGESGESPTNPPNPAEKPNIPNTDLDSE